MRVSWCSFKQTIKEIEMPRGWSDQVNSAKRKNQPLQKALIERILKPYLSSIPWNRGSLQCSRHVHVWNFTNPRSDNHVTIRITLLPKYLTRKLTFFKKIQLLITCVTVWRTGTEFILPFMIPKKFPSWRRKQSFLPPEQTLTWLSQTQQPIDFRLPTAANAG